MQESFYDALAPYYHLLYPDWEASIGRQAQALVTLLGEFAVPPGARVLDAACGIGTQALGLAAAGYDVVASDLSAGALSRLRGEAERRGLSIHSRVADLRTLSESFTDPFAAVLACDNAVAHLLTDAEIATALTKCRRCLRSGGLLILSVRDYATILRRSPDVRPYALRTEGDRRCSASQIWEWEGDRYDMTLHLTDESCGENPRVHAFHTRLYAVTIARLLELLAAAGFAHVERRDGAFFQPLVIGVAP